MAIYITCNCRLYNGKFTVQISAFIISLQLNRILCVIRYSRHLTRNPRTYGIDSEYLSKCIGVALDIKGYHKYIDGNVWIPLYSTCSGPSASKNASACA